MITLGKEEMATIRKIRRKWQAIVKRRNLRVQKSFGWSYSISLVGISFNMFIGNVGKW